MKNMEEFVNAAVREDVDNATRFNISYADISSLLSFENTIAVQDIQQSVWFTTTFVGDDFHNVVAAWMEFN